MNKLYFIGEYGYVFRQLLPFLETYPGSIELLTWKPVCSIIEILWPGRYKLIQAETLLDPKVCHLRDCNHLRDIKSVRKLEMLGYRHIASLDPGRRIFHDNAHKIFGILKRKLVYGKQNLSKPYVSVFPRNRIIQVSKNNINETHIDLLRKKHPDKEIVGHGLASERFELNIRYCENIYEQINVLNNSIYLLTPPSGLADLALVCGCNVVINGPYSCIERTNPHNCSITYFEESK